MWPQHVSCGLPYGSEIVGRKFKLHSFSALYCTYVLFLVLVDSTVISCTRCALFLELRRLNSVSSLNLNISSDLQTSRLRTPSSTREARCVSPAATRRCRSSPAPQRARRLRRLSTGRAGQRSGEGRPLCGAERVPRAGVRRPSGTSSVLGPRQAARGRRRPPRDPLPFGRPRG